MNSPKKTMVQCGDHGYAPGGIVCVHLIAGAPDWHSAGHDLDTENDWLCSECMAKAPDLSVDDLSLLCRHCIRKLQRQAGFKPES